MGNAFSHGSNLKHIVADAVRDVAEQAAAKMSASPEMAKLASGSARPGQ